MVWSLRLGPLLASPPDGGAPAEWVERVKTRVHHVSVIRCDGCEHAGPHDTAFPLMCENPSAKTDKKRDEKAEMASVNARENRNRAATVKHRYLRIAKTEAVAVQYRK